MRFIHYLYTSIVFYIFKKKADSNIFRLSYLNNKLEIHIQDYIFLYSQDELSETLFDRMGNLIVRGKLSKLHLLHLTQ